MVTNHLSAPEKSGLTFPKPKAEPVSNDVETAFTCQGWPSGSSCGRKAGTPYTHIYCDYCDTKRREHIAKAIDHGGVLAPSIPEPVVQPVEYIDYCGFSNAELAAREQDRLTENFCRGENGVTFDDIQRAHEAFREKHSYHVDTFDHAAAEEFRARHPWRVGVYQDPLTVEVNETAEIEKRVWDALNTKAHESPMPGLNRLREYREIEKQYRLAVSYGMGLHSFGKMMAADFAEIEKRVAALIPDHGAPAWRASGVEQWTECPAAQQKSINPGVKDDGHGSL